jgi:hypothetical protein
MRAYRREELETVAKDVFARPPELVAKMKQLLELAAK